MCKIKGKFLLINVLKGFYGVGLNMYVYKTNGKEKDDQLTQNDVSQQNLIKLYVHDEWGIMDTNLGIIRTELRNSLELFFISCYFSVVGIRF